MEDANQQWNPLAPVRNDEMQRETIAAESP
jgi:hypothetical protein